jgi:signal transduction histidine kinase
MLIDNLKNDETEDTEEFLNIISLSAKNTLSLLDNLLGWARSQTGQLTFKPEKLLLSPIIQKILDISISNAKIKNITLNYKASGNIEVYADENMLRTVLRNLISNAVKFTKPRGDINVSAISKQNKVEISIADNGVGINKETCKKLFNISKNMSTVGTVDEVGSGLGLVLCKEFVKKLGGKIWVESELGKGSNFKFTVPLHKSS